MGMHRALYDLAKAAPGFSEVTQIRLLKHLRLLADENPHPRLAELRARAAMRRRLAECAEDGMVGLIKFERDCDCAESTGPWRLIPADIEAFEEAWNYVADGAEGPFDLWVVKPSEFRTTEATHRDRVMEAFENGRSYRV